MLTVLNYQKLPENWNAGTKDCCDKEDPENPRGCDCCYDSWQDELKEVNLSYNDSQEKVNQLKGKLTVLTDRRDRLKTWYDEMTTANELARKICDQLEILIEQTGKVATNTCLTVKAIKTLYCMIRDFYMQIDLIKSKYDRLNNCIKCLNNSAFASGQGIMTCLEDYGKKLDTLIATRDGLLQMLMEVIQIAWRLNRNIDVDFGISTVLTEWQVVFNCAQGCEDEGESCSPTAAAAKGNSAVQQQQMQSEESCLGPCDLSPIFKFPICKDDYYKCVDEQYEADKKAADEIAKQLLSENKNKEGLLACKQSLESAIKEVDPKNRCK